MERRMTQTLRPYQQRGVAEIGANFAGAARQIFPVPSALEVFRARAEARAHLHAAGELDLHRAVDVLQDAAERTGLVTSLGQDGVQALMTNAFRAIQLAPDSDAPSSPPNEPHGTAVSTLMAAEFLVRLGDPERLRVWLAGHSADERAAIRQHLERKQVKRCR
jgi:hypothetical protein